MAMDSGSSKHWMMHKKMMGGKMIVLGLLIIANAYFGIFNWPWFIGGVLVLAGILKLAMPACKRCRM
jgi:uncharacterized membrane protein HdeD (DUF308 family)